MIFGMLANHIVKSINMKYEVWELPGDRGTAFQSFEVHIS